MLNNNRIGYMHFWCQKVLPLVYDNSLSYYEVLLKIRKKLNEVIEFTNDIPEYIDQKFIEAFDEDHLKELISEVFRTIEDAITANNEGTNTHFSTDYSKGTLIWHDNKLYKVKHDVDTGDTIVVNENVELVNFADMFADFISEIKGNFTTNDDGLRETSSTDRPIHDLVWLGGILYEVIKPIAEGNAYIYSGTNQNVKPTNLDDIYDYLLDLISSEIDTREQADIQIGEDLDAEVRAREEADTQISEDLGAETTAREEADTAIDNKIGTLSGLSTTDKSDLVAAINEVNQTGGGTVAKIGDMESLKTTEKSTVVGAINENFDKNDHQDVVGVKEFGAVCDGTTDDSDALIAAIAACAGKILVLNGDMLISKPIRIRQPITIRGNNHTINIAQDFPTTGGLVGTSEVFGVNANHVKIDGIQFIGTANTTLDSAIIFNGSYYCEVSNCSFTDIRGCAVWIRDGNYYITVDRCYAYHCDYVARTNSGGAFECALGSNTIANHYITYSNCVASTCGNAGFQMYDSDNGLIVNCVAESMLGLGDWEDGNGIMVEDKVTISNCTVRDIENAGYFITGSNNILEGCRAINCGGMAVDMWTGSREKYGNSIDGCTFESCALHGHPELYDTSGILCGTHQHRLNISNVNITAGGNALTPVNIVGFDVLIDGNFENIHATDVTNVNAGISIRGEQRLNTFFNCDVQDERIYVEEYHATTKFVSSRSYNYIDINASSGNTWTNTTGLNLLVQVGGTISAASVNGYGAGTGGLYFVKHNGTLNVTGTSLTFKATPI